MLCLPQFTEPWRQPQEGEGAHTGGTEAQVCDRYRRSRASSNGLDRNFQNLAESKNPEVSFFVDVFIYLAPWYLVIHALGLVLLCPIEARRLL